MKLMDVFGRRGADAPPHSLCGKGLQRRMAKRDAVSCQPFGETDY